MTSEQLRKILSVRATSRFGERIGRLIAREGLLAETIDLGTDPDPRIAFRASYALEYAFAADPKRMEPHLSAFVDRYAEVSCHGAQRHFSKILALLLRQKSRRLDDRRLDRTIEVTFDRMIDRSVPVAVKVWAMEILARLADERPWIGEQLGDTIRHLMDYGGSPGLCSRGPENLSPAERSQRSPLSARVLEAEYVRARHENMQASLEKPRARKPRPVTVSRNAKTDGYPYDPHSGRNSGSESPNPGRTAFRQILHRTESVREVVATRSPKERYGIPYSACAPGTTRLRRGYRGRQAHEPVDRTADHIGPNRRPHRSGPAA